MVTNHRIAECHREKSGEDDRVHHAVQGQSLEIFEPEKLRAANNPGAIEHLHEAVIDAEDQEDHRKDDLDQDHSPESRARSRSTCSLVVPSPVLLDRLQILNDFVDFLVGEGGLGHEIVIARRRSSRSG